MLLLSRTKEELTFLFDDRRRRHRREVEDVADADAHDDVWTTPGKQFLQDDVTGGREKASEEAWRLDNAMATNEVAVAVMESFIVIVNICHHTHTIQIQPSHHHRHRQSSPPLPLSISGSTCRTNPPDRRRQYKILELSTYEFLSNLIPSHFKFNFKSRPICRRPILYVKQVLFPHVLNKMGAKILAGAGIPTCLLYQNTNKIQIISSD